MPNLLVKKSSDNSNEGYNETVEYKVLHQANVETNHNKYYCIEIQKNTKDQYRLFTHYGRLGISNIYEIRDSIKGVDSPITDYSTVKSEFDDIIKKKLKGKRNKDTGELESYVEVDTVAPTVGSENIRGKAEKKKQISVKAAIDTSSYDGKVAKLIDQLIEENVHSITTHTSIKYTSNGFATEIGAVTKEHVDKARQPLTELNKIMGDKGRVDPSQPEVKRLNSLYFSLIPKPFSRKITESDLILDAEQLQSEYDILDQLSTAVSMGSAMSGSTSQKMNALGTDIKILDNLEEVKRIKKFVKESKANNHRGMNVWGYDVKNIYTVLIPEERARYDRLGKSKGNIKEVFHGSSGSNCLSILKSGLYIPPANAPHVCGRMMGRGAYFALSSSKSMNYSVGFWGGRKSTYNNAFLFIADLALGRYYETYSAMPSGTPVGYDSIWAKAGKSLYNDELVTPNIEQQTIKYIIEMTPGGR